MEVTARKKKRQPKLDMGGLPREWPGPHGPMISKNPDFGSGPFSQNTGLPYGGVSAGEFIKNKRKRRNKRNKILSNVVTSIEKLSAEYYHWCINVSK